MNTAGNTVSEIDPLDDASNRLFSNDWLRRVCRRRPCA